MGLDGYMMLMEKAKLKYVHFICRFLHYMLAVFNLLFLHAERKYVHVCLTVCACVSLCSLTENQLARAAAAAAGFAAAKLKRG